VQQMCCRGPGAQTLECQGEQRSEWGALTGISGNKGSDRDKWKQGLVSRGHRPPLHPVLAPSQPAKLA